MTDELALISIPKFDTFEIVKTGTITVASSPPGTTNESITHGLGYVPTTLVYHTPSTNYQLPHIYNFSVNTVTNVITVSVFFDFSVNSTGLTIRISNAGPSTYSNLTFRYYLLRQIASS